MTEFCKSCGGKLERPKPAQIYCSDVCRERANIHKPQPWEPKKKPVICRFCKNDLRERTEKKIKNGEYRTESRIPDFALLRWHIQEKHKEEWAALRRKIYPSPIYWTIK